MQRFSLGGTLLLTAFCACSEEPRNTDPQAGADATLFDMAAFSDPSTAECHFSNQRLAFKDGVLLEVWDLSYQSWESIDGELRPITIRGFAAKPQEASAPLPGIVQAHGLGGFAEPSHATGPAALLGSFVIAYTGPGGGTTPENTSEGLPATHDNGRRIFDTVPDPRGSWLWGHAAAGLRAVTCLANHPAVDADRLGMTGYSAGGVATLIAAAADRRLEAAVPLSGTLGWTAAVESANAWQHALLANAGLSTESSEWQALMRWLDATQLLAHTSAAVWMVNGSSDEFFPLTAHTVSYDALAVEKRSSFIGNADHGCLLTLGAPGVDTPEAIKARADERARGAQRAWFHHAFGSDPRYVCIPAEPQLSIESAGSGSTLSVTADLQCGAFEVESVESWWSHDGGLTYQSMVLENQGEGRYVGTAAFTLDEGASAFADVTYRTLSGDTARFSVSTRPALPAGFVPRIYDMTCQAP